MNEMNQIRVPDKENIDKIIWYLPYFEFKSNEFYKIDSKLSLDPYNYSEKTDKFISTFIMKILFILLIGENEQRSSKIYSKS